MRIRRAVLVGVSLALVAGRATRTAAQQSLTLPSNLIVPNNEGLPVGALGGLEGNAFTARVEDSTAGWFNPAGLAAAPGPSASVSAGTFRFVSISDEAATNSKGSSVSQLPAAFGLVVRKKGDDARWTWSLSVARTAAWTQSTDAQILVPGSLRSYTTLAGDTEFNRATVAIAFGYKTGGAWRFGAGLLGDVLNLRNVQAISYRQETGAAIATAVASYRATGAQATLRLGAGAQADLSAEWKFGAVLRTPGVRILPSGVYALDAVATNGAAQRQYSFFDSNVDFRYKVPFEAAAGIAWVRPEFEIELDVKGQTGYSAYEGFTSTQSIIRIDDSGTGVPPTVTTEPFNGRTFESRAIVNVSVGGHLRLDARGVWKLHAGFNTDRSPVGDADTFFTRVNLMNATLGVSARATHIGGSLGVTYQWGTTEPYLISSTSGQPIARTASKISNFGVLYSVALVF